MLDTVIKDSLRTHIRQMGAAYLVLLFALLITGFAVSNRLQYIQEKERTRFKEMSVELQRKITRQFESYINVLHDVKALYRSSVFVTRDEFHTYIEAIELTNRYPGVKGIGYIQRVRNDALLPFTQRVRNDVSVHPTGYPEFKIFPDGKRKEYYVIEYIEPFTANRAMFGMDLSAKPVLFAALQEARDSGKLVVTERLFLQEITADHSVEYFNIAPIYRKGMPIVSVTDRRKALEGFVFERFQIDQLLSGIIVNAEKSGVDFEIYDGHKSDDTEPIYHHEGEDYYDKNSIPNFFDHTYQLDMGDRQWTLYLHTRPEFRHSLQKDSLLLVILGGTTVSLLLFGVTWMQARNIRERKVQTRALRHQATHDSLTGLSNRDLLYSKLLDALTFSDRSGKPLALLLIDLNGFKEINDTLGHHSGDNLLRQIGPRINSLLTPPDMLARLGGDEFGVLLGSLGDIQEASERAQHILNVIGEPFDLSGLKVKIGASIGIALYPRHGTTVSTLMRCADVAMYIAKKMTNGFAVYDSNLDQHTPRRLALMTELSEAIKENQLLLYYQPIIDVDGLSVRSVEALIRWQHPTQGLLPSDQFIPEAENSELIKPITLWVLDNALAQYRHWQASGHEIRVAVNISVRNLLDSELPDKIANLLEKHQVNPEMLELEITESAIILDPDRCFDTLMRACAIGCPITIDDFGTGYSSLSYLKRLPVTSLKIDQSFVTEMEKDESDAVIVRSIIDLAHNLGLNVIAEGVENQGVLDLLEILGCDQAQGYFICRPDRAEKLLLWLNRFTSRKDRRAI